MISHRHTEFSWQRTPREPGSPFETGKITQQGCGFAGQLTIELFGGENLYTMQTAGGHFGHITITKTTADSPIETHAFVGYRKDDKIRYDHIVIDGTQDRKGGKIVDVAHSNISDEESFKLAHEIFASWLPEPVRNLDFIREIVTYKREG